MNRHGFTLIEIVIVVLIVGLLAAIAIPNYVRSQNRAKEARVVGNCHTVQIAAEYFATGNDGVYASDTDTDTNASGETITGVLPDGGVLENPFTRAATEPLSSGPAANPGETGYVPVVDTGVNIGYIITGYGISANVVTLVNG